LAFSSGRWAPGAQPDFERPMKPTRVGAILISCFEKIRRFDKAVWKLIEVERVEKYLAKYF
jgi:hypothetical protein